ncbi:histidine-phosphotransfer domain HPT domain-containing protein [Punctularia strigosozonata HHB-11173 SS5]|uniref:histidine-phosphotransfer domain HPT domain-containing protein n=1 Tax=Punctularia strigosozonata (strain HHB-11173) TaxID=741275 RepID=UPI0004417FB4|nr:histidine-phosphotransfer domain HPT domain-containing protein [Punctularia strigosozonata HHB-11173 SS5]EIN12349.1 histidine-phosphotransfer domain HPT domain-containing protein [Punctularia strigosozonata HHB-11173 SS5]
MPGRSVAPAAEKAVPSASKASNVRPAPPSRTASTASVRSVHRVPSQPVPVAGPVDLEVFQQVLELDDEDDHEFSKGMVSAFFTQAALTFGDMDQAFAKKDLKRLSSLGHFLKGSSAALGVARVSATCAKIQHYGQLRDDETQAVISPETALKFIQPLLVRVREEYATAEQWLRKWYKDSGAGSIS